MNLKEKYLHAPKWQKAILWTVFVFLFLLLLLWAGLAWYISAHKESLKVNIETALSENLNGQLTMEDIEPVLFRSFPNISIRVKGIRLIDSLYAQHKRPTVQLNSLYVKINLASLVKGKPSISNIQLTEGKIHLFTDTNGYSNNYLFRKKDRKKTSKEKKSIQINNFDIVNVQLLIDHHQRDKQFKLDLNSVHGSIKEQGPITRVKLRLKTYIHQLGFRMSKGGFLTGKRLNGSVVLKFDSVKETMEVPESKLSVEGAPVYYSALFQLDKKPVTFNMLIKSPKIAYAEGSSMLSEHISNKLDKIQVDQAIAVQASINGSFKYPDTPIVNVYFKTKNNTIHTSYGSLTKATFSGSFTNYYQAGAGMADNNSALKIPTLKGEWEDIPLRIDSISMLTTLHPLIAGHIRSDFPVERLNKIAGNTFNLKNGDASIDLKYQGPLNATDTYEYNLVGSVQLRDVALSYLPRSLNFIHSHVTIEFTGKDLYLKNTTLSTPKSSIRLNGVATDFLKIYFTDPGKVVFNWNLKSDLIDLNEFRSFLSKRKSPTLTSSRRQSKRIAQFNQQLNEMLDQSSIFLKLDIGKVIYRNFNAQEVKADLAFKNEEIEINNVHLRHAGGSLSAKLRVQNLAVGNRFSIKAKVNSVEVDRLFKAFENFGQTSLTADNLSGSFSADIDVKGNLKESGNLVKQSLGGRVDFKLTNGALINFKPLLQIQKFVFKKRNLDHITFKTLEDRLDIHQGKVKIYPMLIESSAINMKVQGIYSLGPGTDIAMEVPLRDPQKDIDRINKGLAPKKKKGIIIYLRATDGPNGKVQISWDPFKKGQPKPEEEEELEEEE